MVLQANSDRGANRAVGDCVLADACRFQREIERVIDAKI
jgi:hypothetical protein